MNQLIELLTPPINFAVVQLPERAFPGVVIQGDTLKGLVTQFTRLKTLLEANQLEELSVDLNEVEAQFSDVLAHYESVCLAQRRNLPYAKP